MTYATNTTVSEDKSRLEVEKMLMKYGATRFGYLREPGKALVCFTYKKLTIQMEIPLPSPDDRRFAVTPSKKWARTPEAKREAYEGEVRRRWRSLALAIKAKLIAVEDGVATFEAEFLPYMVAADGRTIAQKLLPVIEAAKEGGTLNAMLMLPAPEDVSAGSPLN